jgi:hypothetical protein
MNHRTWVIDLVLKFRLATAEADKRQGPTTPKLDHANDDLSDIGEAFQKDLIHGSAWIRNPS